MIIETQDSGTNVRAEIVEGPGAGSLTVPRHIHEERRETHAHAARQLANRPAVREIEETETGFRFEV